VLNIAIMTSYLSRPDKRVSHLISTHPSIMIGIVNQIQTSITSEVEFTCVNMKEMQKKSKRIQNIQDRIKKKNKRRKKVQDRKQAPSPPPPPQIKP
jgi:uncharacterized membrane protein (DUF106 family)